MLVDVDSFKLSNALMEIIKNADEAMKSPTARTHMIWIRANTAQLAPAAKQYARIEITDNGPGIRAEVRKKLFEPFVTTKNGTGLGLAIAKSIIEHTKELSKATTVPAEEHGSLFIFLCLPDQMIAIEKEEQCLGFW